MFLETRERERERERDKTCISMHSCLITTWLAIVGGECRCWLDIGFIPCVQRKLQIRYIVKFSLREVLGSEIFWVMKTMEVLSMTNSRVLYQLVSNLAINPYFKVTFILISSW